MSKQSMDFVDQTARLQNANINKPVQVIAVTAGKGGVGKTNISVNLSMALAARNQRVILFDADLALANVDVLLGLHPKKNLCHAIHGECELSDILLEGPNGIKIIPSSSGIEMMSSLSQIEHAGIINAFNDLSEQVDIMIIDTAAGVSDHVVSFTRAAQEVVVVVCDEPTSITDAYALIKLLSRQHQISQFHILANMVNNHADGRALFNKINRVAEKFLSVHLSYLGAVPFDEYLRKAVKKQKAVYDCYPGSKATESFNKIASKIINWPLPNELSGRTSFFIERMLQTA